MSRIRWRPVVLVLVLSCKGDAPVPDDSEPEVEGDADSDADSDSDTDADGDCDAGDVLSQGTDWVQVSTGYYFACGVRSDYRLQCWGSNYWGELEVPEGEYVYVSAGTGLACGIRTDGRGICWGNELQHERLFSPFGEGLQDIDTDGRCVCYVDGLGDIVCDGVAGNCPQSVNGSFADVALGYGYFLALTETGEIVCEGSVQNGECEVPTGVWQDVGAGSGYGCALDAAGMILCWGEVGWSSVGDPIDVPMGTFVQFESDVDHSCAVDASGNVVSWGGYSFVFWVQITLDDDGFQ